MKIPLKETIYLLNAKKKCWKCKVETIVYAIKSENKIFSYVDDMSSNLLKIIKKKSPVYYRDFSQQIKQEYFINHCNKCKIKIGDNGLHFEEDSPFSNSYNYSKKKLPNINNAWINVLHGVEEIMPDNKIKCNLCYTEISKGVRVCLGCGGDVIYGVTREEIKARSSSIHISTTIFIFVIIIFAFPATREYFFWFLSAFIFSYFMGLFYGLYKVIGLKKSQKNIIRTIRHNNK